MNGPACAFSCARVGRLFRREVNMAPWVVAGAMALQKFQEGRQKSAARKGAISDMHSQRAAAYGYPTEAYGAQQQARAIDDIEGPNYLGMLMDAEDKRKARGGKMENSDYMRAFMG